MAKRDELIAAQKTYKDAKDDYNKVAADKVRKVKEAEEAAAQARKKDEEDRIKKEVETFLKRENAINSNLKNFN